MPDPALAAYGSLPFAEQIAFFKAKVELPSERWTDLWQAAHDRAFVVAGALKADLLADLRAAVLQGVAAGGTLAEFRRDFEALVEKHGWTGWTGEDSAGGHAWRTRVIYGTNLRTSHAAGRHAQAQALAARRPYWRYRHNDTVTHPRLLHKSWDGLVLRHDDPWWRSHFPPNGWGCRCYFETLADRDLDRLGKEGPDRAPDDGTYDWVDKRTKVVHRGIPQGIDPGWDYAPGANVATPLRQLIDEKLFNLEAPIGAALWESLKGAVALERETAWWQTLDEWLATDQIGRSAVVGALTPESLAWLLAEKQIAPQSAAIAVQEGLLRGTKQARHEKAGDGLMTEEWRRLPEILDHPDQILFDKRSGKLVYVVDSSDAGIKLAVEFDYRAGKNARTNMIVSGFRQSAETIAQMIRGKLYEVVK